MLGVSRETYRSKRTPPELSLQQLHLSGLAPGERIPRESGSSGRADPSSLARDLVDLMFKWSERTESPSPASFSFSFSFGLRQDLILHSSLGRMKLTENVVLYRWAWYPDHNSSIRDTVAGRLGV